MLQKLLDKFHGSVIYFSQAPGNTTNGQYLENYLPEMKITVRLSSHS